MTMANVPQRQMSDDPVQTGLVILARIIARATLDSRSEARADTPVEPSGREASAVQCAQLPAEVRAR